MIRKNKGVNRMEYEMKGEPIRVLLVEDDPGDVELTLEVLDIEKVKLDLNVVEDGVEALAYLRKQGKYAEATRPDLILLDLNMPRKDGRETLDEIKQDDELKSIPVVILTTSDSDEDILRTYTHGASCYIKKPVGLNEFHTVVKSIEQFWLTVVRFPPNK
jgi:two-component system, chemotaxis family, response regulator Rcp1